MKQEKKRAPSSNGDVLAADDVLRRMLATTPDPHVKQPKPKKPAKRASK